MRLDFGRLGQWVWCVVLCALLLPMYGQCFEAGKADGQKGGESGDHGNVYERHAAHAVQALEQWYDIDTGLYKSTGWWNAANVITVLADYAKVSHSRDFDYVFSNTLSLAQKTSPEFINKFYDDEGWWALAWIDVYGVTHDQRYLRAAQTIFADMTYGWDDTCSGGIWWSKDRKYKNAIANELFLSVAAQLAGVTKDPQERAEYVRWAKREWSWFSHSGMVNDKHLINDGLDENCKNNQKTTWTYNQGVILGGLVALHKVDRDPAYVVEADETAKAAISGLSDTVGICTIIANPSAGATERNSKAILCVTESSQ